MSSSQSFKYDDPVYPSKIDSGNDSRELRFTMSNWKMMINNPAYMGHAKFSDLTCLAELAKAYCNVIDENRGGLKIENFQINGGKGQFLTTNKELIDYYLLNPSFTIASGGSLNGNLSLIQVYFIVETEVPFKNAFNPIPSTYQGSSSTNQGSSTTNGWSLSASGGAFGKAGTGSLTGSISHSKTTSVSVSRLTQDVEVSRNPSPFDLPQKFKGVNIPNIKIDEDKRIVWRYDMSNGNPSNPITTDTSDLDLAHGFCWLVDDKERKNLKKGFPLKVTIKCLFAIKQEIISELDKYFGGQKSWKMPLELFGTEYLLNGNSYGVCNTAWADDIVYPAVGNNIYLDWPTKGGGTF